MATANRAGADMDATAFTVLILGITCLAAAAVGGGLKIYKAEFPLIASVRRQMLLATVGGLAISLALVLLFSTTSGDERGGDRAASPTSETRVSPSRQPGSATAAAPKPGTVFWKGEREFEGSGTSYDLDAAPGAPQREEDLSYDAGSQTISMDRSPDSAAWPGPTPPTSTDCRQRVKTHRQQDVKVQSDTMMCLITDQDRVASLRVKELGTRDGLGIAVVEITVWNPS
jgi:hypothetical protein